LDAKPEGGRSMAWNKHGWEDGIKVDLKKKVWRMWIELI
jgi:hypothetical protein